MTDKIRIGIIGTGFARLTQIPSFLEAGAEVVSVASAQLANAERAAQDFNIKHFTDDWRETVARDDVDLISIVTPPVFHREMALAALDAGKHVLCEKPMAMNAAEAREMTERAKSANRLALINHELRFLNGRRRAYSMIEAGEIGKITHVKLNFRNASRGSREVKWNWWSNIESGGGVLGAIGSHAVDAFHWLTDAQISETFCRLKINVKQRPDANGEERAVTSDDEANLIVRFDDSNRTSDASGTISLSVVEAGKYEHRLEIFGDEGSLMIGSGGELFHSKMTDNDWRPIDIDLGETAPNTKPGEWSRGFLNFAREIVNALQDGKTEVELAATFADGLKTQIVLDAARESNQTNSAVKLAPEQFTAASR